MTVVYHNHYDMNTIIWVTPDGVYYRNQTDHQDLYECTNLGKLIPHGRRALWNPRPNMEIEEDEIILIR